jgi:hypothetical protein
MIEDLDQDTEKNSRSFHSRRSRPPVKIVRLYSASYQDFNDYTKKTLGFSFALWSPDLQRHPEFFVALPASCPGGGLHSGCVHSRK